MHYSLTLESEVLGLNLQSYNFVNTYMTNFIAANIFLITLI